MEKQKYYNVKKDEFYTEKAYQYYCKKIGMKKVKTQKGWVDNEFVIYTMLGMLTRVDTIVSIKEAQNFKTRFLSKRFNLTQKEINAIDILKL